MAPLNAWPFVGRLQMINRRIAGCRNKLCGQCGVAILTANWVITAAHCCHENRRPKLVRLADQMKIVLGTNFDTSCSYSGMCEGYDPRLHTTVASEQTFNAKELYISPTYQYGRIRLESDFCLIKIDGDIILDGKTTAPIEVSGNRLSKLYE